MSTKLYMCELCEVYLSIIKDFFEFFVMQNKCNSHVVESLAR